MADEKPKNSEVPHVQAGHGSTSVGSLNVGNVGGSVAVGNNISIINYYAANGEQREMRTGWFFGHRYGDADIDPSQRDCSSPLTETFLRGLSSAGMKSKSKAICRVRTETGLLRRAAVLLQGGV
jgi:hypothetical protein